MRGQGSKIASTGFEAFASVDQSALDAIPTGFCVCRADGALVRYNKRAVELWGRAPQLGDTGEFSETKFRRYTPQGVPLPFAASPVAVALRSGVPIRGQELFIERPDGSLTPVLMNVAPVKNADGQIDGAVCSFQELTERKRAEEALRASEAELQSVINRTPFMLVRCGRDLRYRFVSEAYAHLIARARDEVIGKSIDAMIGARGLRTLRPYIDAVLKGEPVDFECELEFPHSGLRTLAIAYRPHRQLESGRRAPVRIFRRRNDRQADRHHHPRSSPGRGTADPGSRQSRCPHRALRDDSPLQRRSAGRCFAHRVADARRTRHDRRRLENRPRRERAQARRSGRDQARRRAGGAVSLHQSALSRRVDQKHL